MDLFKAYVPTRDKKCLVRFKNRRSQDLYSLEDVEKMPEYAGILADETVLIDVDLKFNLHFPFSIFHFSSDCQQQIVH